MIAKTSSLIPYISLTFTRHAEQHAIYFIKMLKKTFPTSTYYLHYEYLKHLDRLRDCEHLHFYDMILDPTMKIDEVGNKKTCPR